MIQIQICNVYGIYCKVISIDVQVQITLPVLTDLTLDSEFCKLSSGNMASNSNNPAPDTEEAPMMI